MESRHNSRSTEPLLKIPTTSVYKNILSYKMWLAPSESLSFLSDGYLITKSQPELKLELGVIFTHHHRRVVHFFVWRTIRRLSLLGIHNNSRSTRLQELNDAKTMGTSNDFVEAISHQLAYSCPLTIDIRISTSKGLLPCPIFVLTTTSRSNALV